MPAAEPGSRHAPSARRHRRQFPIDQQIAIDIAEYEGGKRGLEYRPASTEEIEQAPCRFSWGGPSMNGGVVYVPGNNPQGPAVALSVVKRVDVMEYDPIQVRNMRYHNGDGHESAELRLGRTAGRRQGDPAERHQAGERTSRRGNRVPPAREADGHPEEDLEAPPGRDVSPRSIAPSPCKTSVDLPARLGPASTDSRPRQARLGRATSEGSIVTGVLDSKNRTGEERIGRSIRGSTGRKRSGRGERCRTRGIRQRDGAKATPTG